MHELKLALERIKNEAISLADAQVIALEALSGVCPCGDRKKSDCPGEWEPGCDLGNNEKYASVLDKRTAKAIYKQFEIENAFYNKPSGD